MAFRKTQSILAHLAHTKLGEMFFYFLTETISARKNSKAEQNGDLVNKPPEKTENIFKIGKNCSYPVRLYGLMCGARLPTTGIIHKNWLDLSMRSTIVACNQKLSTCSLIH